MICMNKLHWKYMHTRTVQIAPMINKNRLGPLTFKQVFFKKMKWNLKKIKLSLYQLESTSRQKPTDWTHLRQSSAAARLRKDEGSLSPQQSSEEQPHLWPERALQRADSTAVPPPVDKHQRFRQWAGRVFFPTRRRCSPFRALQTNQRSIDRIKLPRGKKKSSKQHHQKN